MFPWEAMIAAVKRSVDFPGFDAFYADLFESLPQNSPETRRRVANLIARAYFPNRSLEDLPTRVWCAYRRDDLLAGIMRVMALEAEPVIARFVLEQVLVLESGAVFDAARARDFVGTTFGRSDPKSYQRLLTTTHHLGFLARSGQQWSVSAIARPADTFLILLHARFAPTPRIVRMSDILSAPFWRYLGMRSPAEVRAVLHEADAARLIARYVTVDELEQVTTCYSFDEYLSERIAL